MKLLLADDHRLFRDSLVQYLERADMNASIDVADNLDGAMELLAQNAQYDLVILDLRMPGMHGMSGFKRVREAYADTPAAMISGIAEEADVMEAFDLGAVGYFPKTMSGKTLLQAIKLVLAGERFMPMDQNNNAIMPSYYDDGEQKAGFKVNSERSASFKLTPRETEVLSHLMHGISNKEIAKTLGLQVVTVKLHVRGICRKLEVKNRTQAALKAHEVGLAQST